MVGTCFALERRLGLVAHVRTVGVGRTGQLQLEVSAAAKEGAYVGLRRTVQWEVGVGDRG